MTKRSKYSDWVDAYVRDRLADEEIVMFEEQLLEDIELQDELETVLALKAALKLDDEWGSAGLSKVASSHNQWSSLAIAASVLLAITSTTFYWRTSVEAGRLQEQVSALQAPRTAVLTVPVDIMRSAGGAKADVIIQKPAGHGVIVLDIELSQGFQGLDLVGFQLKASDSTAVLNWTAAPTYSGRAIVVLNAEVIPDGLVNLQISDPSGELQENRLLEFRR